MRKHIPYLWAALLLFASCRSAFAAEYDLAVYGGTASSVITAVSGARQGLKVVLLEPGRHLSGMATGGLSRTDFGKKEVIGGYALEFYWRVGLKYALDRFAQPEAWYYEPHVGEAVFREMLEQAHVNVLFGHRLRERQGVKKKSIAGGWQKTNSKIPNTGRISFISERLYGKSCRRRI